MAQHAGPHDVRAGVVVLGLGQHARGLGADGAHDGQVHAVGDGHGAHVVEEALEQMAEHVGDAGGCLERRQREREFGVHERQLRALVVACVAGLHAQLVVADDGVLRSLAAGCRDGENHGDGQHIGVRVLLGDELPHVVIDAGAVGDGLRGVDNRAAAHGQHPVHAVFLAQRDTLAHQANLWIGAHAAQFHVLDASLLKRRAHAVDEARLNGALPAVVQQHLMRAALGQHGADLAFGVVAEHEMRRGNELEVFHGNRLPWFRDAAPPTLARKQHDALSITRTAPVSCRCTREKIKPGRKDPAFERNPDRQCAGSWQPAFRLATEPANPRQSIWRR